MAHSSSSVIREESDLIEGEHSVIVVQGNDGEALADPWNGNTLVEVDNEAALGDLWVTTGDQFGPYAVTTRLWDGPPGEPGDSWEDVVEISVRPRGGLVVTEMIDQTPAIPLTDEPGSYRLRVSARGREVDRDEDEPDGEEPLEWYLLDVWTAPPSDPQVLRLTSAWASRILDPPPPLVIPEAEAGLAAARAIGRDVDGLPGARALSGEVTTVEVQRTIPGTRRKLFRWCAHLTTWSHVWIGESSWSWAGLGGSTEEYSTGAEHWASAFSHPDQMSGQRGTIGYSFIEVEKPHRAVRQWQWLVGSRGGHATLTDHVPFLAEPTRMTVTLTQHRDKDGDPQTTIDIAHERVPVEWAEDLRTYWDYQLAIAQHAEFGKSK